MNQPTPDLSQEPALFKIERHPIGILGIYIASAVLLITSAVVAFGLVPKFVTTVSTSEVYGVAGAAYLIFMFLVLGFVYVAHVVYWGNRWVLSNESLTQVTRTSLFDKQSSHLSLGNLQDVTAEQDGIFQQIFHYGSLKVETAGERSKFVFPFCPNPNYYAQQILEARERLERSGRAVNSGLQTPRGDNTTYQQPVPQPAPTPTNPQPTTVYPLPPPPIDYNQPPTT